MKLLFVLVFGDAIPSDIGGKAQKYLEEALQSAAKEDTEAARQKRMESAWGMLRNGEEVNW